MTVAYIARIAASLIFLYHFLIILLFPLLVQLLRLALDVDRGKDGGRFIPPGNKLKEQIGTLEVHREVTDLVDDEHLILGQNPELVRQAVLKKWSF